MVRKIKYKSISQDLEKMVGIPTDSSVRSAIGTEGKIVEYHYISVDQLVPFANQARKSFDNKNLLALADSIKEHGILQPLTIMKSNNNQYEVISGERRLRAAKIAKLLEVPCIILKKEKNIEAIALIENIHRKDLHPIELGDAYNTLIEKGVFLTQTSLGRAIAVSKSTISELIKYSKIDKEIKEYAIKHNVLGRRLRKLMNSGNLEGNKLDTLNSRIENFSPSKKPLVFFDNGALKFHDQNLKSLSSQNRTIIIQYLEGLNS